MLKAKALIQMACMNICGYNGIELKDSKSVFLAFLQRILYKLLSDMQPTRI